MTFVNTYYRADSRSVNLKNNRGNIQRKSGKALYNVSESLPGDWQTFTDNNIRLAEQEREASIRLRGIIGSTLSNTSQDLREQADRVQESLTNRVAETEEATRWVTLTKLAGWLVIVLFPGSWRQT